MTALALLLLLAQSSPQELLARGRSLIASRPAEAVKTLQQALRLDPALPGLRYELGLAYHAIGDEANAEAELREALATAPESPAVHNDLGIVLFQLGNAKAALKEFRIAAQRAPRDPNAHFNLGEAMARTGDSNGALDQLRIAVALAPSDAGLGRLMKSVESALAANEDTIRVDVRQVLVPVVVADREGHHVRGLKQEDFQVFEDGVEQKIAAFSSEEISAQAPQAQAEARGAASQPLAAPKNGARPAVRRTCLILIDTLHSTFNNFIAEREALAKLFKEQRPDDSQYSVIALGASPRIIVNLTSDPNAVLAALDSKRMQTVFQQSQLGGMKADIERFRRDLNETRAACDSIGPAGDHLMIVKCQVGLDRAPMQASALAEEERSLTTGFLRQFRALIAQLARGSDRRTVLFLSEGFQIVAGREAFDLLNAFFPEASNCLVPDTVNCAQTGLQFGERLSGEFDPILEIAARSNVTIDTIDARGLYGQSSFDASGGGARRSVGANVDRVDRNTASANGNTLAEIAEATGGTAFHDSNDLLAGLRRALEDGREYYTLAYVSSNPSTEKKYRRIAVQVRGPGPNPGAVTVHARRGYWAGAQ